MSEREMFEALVAEAPAPSAHLADDVLEVVRHRRRRRWAIGGVCATVLAVGVAVPIAISGGDAQPGLDRGGHTLGRPNSTVPAHRVSETAQIYLATIRYAIKAEGELPAGPVWILSHTCRNIIAAGIGPCRPQPIASDVQRDISSTLAVRPEWVDTQPSADPGNPEHGLLITLGPIDPPSDARNHAKVAVSTWCGGLCGSGKTLVLAKGPNGWVVTGTTGPQWIS